MRISQGARIKVLPVARRGCEDSFGVLALLLSIDILSYVDAWLPVIVPCGVHVSGLICVHASTGECARACIQL